MIPKYECPATSAIKTVICGGANLDSFGRLRVSNPETLFDAKNIFDDPDLAASVENQPLLFDNQETSGSGTSTAYDNDEAKQTLTVSATTAGTRVRQTRQRFNYQPGKSMLVFMSFKMHATTSGITQREGMFDESNGLFVEDNGTGYRFVRRTYTSGAAVDNAVEQSSWSLDALDGSGNSGYTLDLTKTNILAIDYEWLGVGRVRMGFVIDGEIIYAHEFLNANSLSVVYMSTPNLPLRSEISNDGTGAAATITQICSTVISEGAQNDLGIIRWASTAGTHIDMATENQLYALMGIKLKSAYIGEVVDILSVAMQLHTASHKVEWSLVYDPTITGTFTYADVSRSAVQVAKSAGAGATASGGYAIEGGYVESGGNPSGASGSTAAEIGNALRIGSNIAGTPDAIVLCARPIAGSSAVDIECGMTWRELT